MNLNPPFQNGEPTEQVASSILASQLEKMSLNSGDLIIVRLSKDYRQRLSPQKVGFWAKAILDKMSKMLKSMKKKDVDAILLDEGVSLEKVPLADLKKIVAKLEAMKAEQKTN